MRTVRGMHLAAAALAVTAAITLAGCSSGPTEADEALSARIVEEQLVGTGRCTNMVSQDWPCIRFTDVYPSSKQARSGDAYCYRVDYLVETTPWDPDQGVPVEPRTYVESSQDPVCLGVYLAYLGDNSDPGNWKIRPEDEVAAFSPLLGALEDELCRRANNCTWS